MLTFSYQNTCHTRIETLLLNTNMNFSVLHTTKFTQPNLYIAEHSIVLLIIQKKKNFELIQVKNGISNIN